MTEGDSAAGLRIVLFGSPKFSYRDVPIKISAPPKTVPLLAYLLLHSGPVKRETVAFTLWPDNTEQEAGANLRRHIHRLVQSLPAADPDEPWIYTEASTLQWNDRAKTSCDVTDFRRLSKAPDSYAEAVALYRGDLLDNVYDDWLFPHREELRNQYLAMCTHLLMESRQRRDANAAIAYAQKILHVDSWREDALRQLMAVRYEAGDRAGALAEYDKFGQRLRAEMSLDPMPETEALAQLIRRNAALPDSASGGRPTPADGEPSHKTALPLVGRSADLDLLRERWDRTAQGRGATVFISGEAGIGKSRLVSEMALLAAFSGGRVMYGATAHPESNPYEAITDAFRSVLPLLTALELEPVWLATLAQLIPELRTRKPDLPPAAPVEPEREKDRLFQTIVMALDALAKARPVLLVLEDLQWAGDATLEAFRHIARRASEASILALVTYRDEETPRIGALRKLVRDLEHQSLSAHLTPGRLTLEDVREMLRLVPGLDEEGKDVASPLHRQSEGNPLFLAEMIRDRTEAPASAEGGSDLRVPTGVRDVILSRVSRLSEKTRWLAEAAAVIGQSFDFEVLHDAIGIHENEAIDGLSEMLDRHLVRESGGRGRHAYVFTHHLIQSVIYSELEPAVAARRHRRIATVLQQIYRDPSGRTPVELSADLALHFDRGGDAEKAAEHYLAAATHALSLSAYNEALSLAARGIALAVEPAVSIELLKLAETAHSYRGNRAEQLEVLEALQNLATRRNDDELMRDILARRILVSRSTGDRQRESTLIADLQARAAASSNARWQARALQELARYRFLTGEYDGARESAEQALSLLDGIDDPSGQVQTLCLLVEIADHRGGYDEAKRLVKRARAAADKRSDTSLLARALMAASHAALLQQDFEECLELADSALLLYGALGDREGQADAIARSAAASTMLDRIDDARKGFREASEIFGSIGKIYGEAANLSNASVLATKVGRLDEAISLADKSLALFRQMSDRRGEASSLCNLSAIGWLQGDAERSRARAQEALAIAHDIQFPVMEAVALANLGNAERLAGDLQSALGHMQQGLAIRRRLQRNSDFVEDMATVAETLLDVPDTRAAYALTREFLPGLALATHTSVWPQYCFFVASKVFAACGRPQRARIMLERAHRTLAQQAETISEPESKAAYFALPMNQAILTAAARPALNRA